MKASVVADGQERLLEATRPERITCRKTVMAELSERYRAQLEQAGFFHRRLLWIRMRREATAIVRERLGLPSDSATFVIAQNRLG